MTTRIYEDTRFFIETDPDREKCPKCKGTTTVGTISYMSDGSNAHTVYCQDDLCYLGYLLTPYEKKIQQIIYQLTTEARRAKQRLKTFEKVSLKERLGFAWRAKIDAVLMDLGGTDYLSRDDEYD